MTTISPAAKYRVSLGWEPHTVRVILDTTQAIAELGQAVCRLSAAMARWEATRGGRPTQVVTCQDGSSRLVVGRGG